MDHRFPARLIVLAALMTVITLSCVASVFYTNYRESLRREVLSTKLQSSIANILLYDEQLTSSALLAAHSGNGEWIERYQSIEPQLTKSIESALQLAESADIMLAAELTESANKILVEIENSVFEKIQNGESHQAVDLLLGKRYQKQKEIYSRGMESFVNLIKQQRTTQLSKQKRRISWLIWTLPITVAMALFLWSMVARSLQRWHARFTKEEALRREAESQVRALNENLENRIDIRTAELEESKKQLSYQANHDELTGLPNRRHVMSFLKEQLHDLRDIERLLVLLIDIDHFKLVNDSLGHAAGDELLQQSAETLKTGMGGKGVVARLGGDEFLLVTRINLLDHNNDQKMKLATSVLEQFSQPFFLQGNRYDLPISPSIGIAVAPDDGKSAEDIIRSADTAMYEAKKSGRNNACLFKSEMNIVNSNRVDLETKLRSALVSGNQFQLHYQPQIDLANDEVVGVEALLRWIQPEDGMIPPDKFIPIAEHTGLILEIGNWVLFEAARQLREWQDNNNLLLDVSINVASQELKQSGFGETVKQTFNQHGTPIDHFGIEITESSLIGNDAMSTTNIAFLGDLGVKLSMDDFGTGYSALSYLKQYPFNVLKIDRSFIASILDIKSDAALVEGIINMSRNINMQVVAEGTETIEQCNLLRSFGCDIAQGYYFSKPLPATELVDFLRKREQLSRNSTPLRKISGM